MDRLRAIEIFIQAADAGSFYKGAVILGVTPQAVSKAIRQLEDELGIALFHRTKRKSSLTQEGAEFLQRVRSGVESVASAWEHARQSVSGEIGLIRLTAAIGVGRALVLPLIQRFQEDYPNIHFELNAEDRHSDIAGEGIDIGFRCGLEPSGQLVVHELMKLQMIVCASPSYLQQHGLPNTRADLGNHRCIGSRRPNTGRLTPWEFFDGESIEFQSVSSTFNTTDVGTELDAALSGMGIALLDGILCSKQIRKKRLIPLFCEQSSERFSVYLYHIHRPDLPWRVREFILYAKSYFSKNLHHFRVEQSELIQHYRNYIDSTDT